MGFRGFILQGQSVINLYRDTRLMPTVYSRDSD